MNVTLPEPLEEFVRRKVAAGEFQSVDAVVCEGIRLLQQQQLWKADARARINEGWNQAKAGQLRTPDEVKENLSARKAAWTKSRG